MAEPAQAKLSSDEPATAVFPVPPGAPVTAWALSPIEEAYYPGIAAPAEDRVNYRFINGFVDVGDLPCRKALLEDIKTREVALKTDWPLHSINLPGFNRRLDFSGFWHRPTRLSRWCRTTLTPPADGTFDFSITTCGGVHIWVDGKPVVKFEPFTRNTEHTKPISLPLKASGSDVVLLTEDLAERDTNWYVELTSHGDVTLQSSVPGGARQEDLDTLLALAANVRPAQEFFRGGPLELLFDTPVATDITITAHVQQSVHMQHRPPHFSGRAVLHAGSECVTFFGIETLADGYHPLDLTFEIGAARVQRHIGFALLRSATPPPQPADLTGRKRAALEFAAAHGDMRIGRALAALATGRPMDAIVAAIIDDTLTMIEERRDCSDFVIVPLLWVYGAFGKLLPHELAERTKTAILDYRYWVDEPGNDTMWFWSENHTLCFHVAQLLAGNLFPGDLFSASGRTGAEQAHVASIRLNKWFTSVEAHGLAEWNSAAYYPIDFIGLLALDHWADDTIAARAKKLLGRLFTMIALHTLGGVAAGTQGRAYDKELRAGPLTELAPFATLAFGEGWLNDGVAALPMFAAGAYVPPEGIERYARPDPGTALTAHYVQGYERAAHLALYKCSSVQLSASVDGTPGEKGHQQHLLDIRFAGHPFARAWINHPGEDDPWGHQRPSYWAGNGIMPRIGLHQDTALMLYDLRSDPRIDFTHLYAPTEAFDEARLFGNWLVLRSASGFAAFAASAPIFPVETGPGAQREFRASAPKVAWVATVGELAAGTNLAALEPVLAQTKLSFDPVAMRATLDRPSRAPLMLDYARGLFVDDEPLVFPGSGLDPMVRTVTAPVQF